MGMPFPPLPLGQFDIIYADPPWDYKGQLQHAGEGSQDTGGAVRHYPTVTLDDLKDVRRSKNFGARLPLVHVGDQSAPGPGDRPG